MPKNEPSISDPLELIGVTVPTGESELLFMAECFIEEYIKIGYSDTQIMNFFQNPFFRGTHIIYQYKGEKFVQDLIQTAREKWGYFLQNTEAANLS